MSNASANRGATPLRRSPSPRPPRPPPPPSAYPGCASGLRPLASLAACVTHPMRGCTASKRPPRSPLPPWRAGQVLMRNGPRLRASCGPTACTNAQNLRVKRDSSDAHRRKRRTSRAHGLNCLGCREYLIFAMKFARDEVGRLATVSQATGNGDGITLRGAIVVAYWLGLCCSSAGG